MRSRDTRGMESTGVYWRPVYAVREGDFELIVGNARHIRNVTGRKTDVKDAEWIDRKELCPAAPAAGIARTAALPPQTGPECQWRREFPQNRRAEFPHFILI